MLGLRSRPLNHNLCLRVSTLSVPLTLSLLSACAATSESDAVTSKKQQQDSVASEYTCEDIAENALALSGQAKQLYIDSLEKMRKTQTQENQFSYDTSEISQDNQMIVNEGNQHWLHEAENCRDKKAGLLRHYLYTYNSREANYCDKKKQIEVLFFSAIEENFPRYYYCISSENGRFFVDDIYYTHADEVFKIYDIRGETNCTDTKVSVPPKRSCDE